MQKIKIEDKIDIRIDSFIANELDISRSKIVKMIKQGSILVNQKRVKSSYVPTIGDIITIDNYEEEPITVIPEKMDLDIVYEDNDVLVINKANGVVVHPAAG